MKQSQKVVKETEIFMTTDKLSIKRTYNFLGEVKCSIKSDQHPKKQVSFNAEQ